MRSLLLISLSIGMVPLLSSTVQAVPEPSTEPLELSLLEPGAPLNNRYVITANTISQSDLTIPSLWWAREQFASQLLDNWIAYPADGTNAGRIDLIVNRRLWNALDYLQRYEFVNRFGTVARDYGYNIRVFNYRQELLATYTCEFTTTPQCQIGYLSTTASSGLRRFGESQNGTMLQQETESQ
ncbi:hypothetical protein [Gloeocapsopsis dulcis]|uniref:Uncharacterized protein n=1 Tax=Gloeocapsopsis dulcis AAB1 = 1H9 TaxID=1433147 RepID=A0A6N8FSM8_9CHRO|nr:hypothetical protein [Gloeocapsopsis dulcis]MUL36140.1 hypothetical protein [Gloeocapsopsis dulcis AAB1 = 1H9]WNN91385.1 hypothetical protein P0S91_10070 [Gloeocapsopsis dulcis]